MARLGRAEEAEEAMSVSKDLRGRYLRQARP